MNLNNLKKEIARAKKASTSLLSLTAQERRGVLAKLADALTKNSLMIIEANKKDVREAERSGKPTSFIERLSLDEKKILGMSESVRTIADAKDVLFETLEETRRPSGLHIKKVRFPLGLVAMIYESRPNVTIEAFAIAFKSGNALLLKGGKEICHTNKALIALIHKALTEEHVHTDSVKDVSGLEKELTLELMQNTAIDCLIPRGGHGLIAFVKEHARVPVIITGASVVHTYIDKSADITDAVRIIVNAKTRRVSICNALDVALVHKDVSSEVLGLLAVELSKRNVEIRADAESYRILKQCGYVHLTRAKKADFDTEFLDYVLAVKIVGDFEGAMQHIETHSLGHSEAIVTRSKKQTEEFFLRIDAACLYVNTSTQFSDGGEFGLGGEIGVSTQKLHARGPFATAELTTYKYLVESDGAVRK